MKNIIFIIITILYSSLVYGQNEKKKITEQLEVIKISDNTYIHTSQGNNGIVYFNNGEAILVSTPMTNEITKDLIKWVETSMKSKIVGYIIDMWHPDAMGGLNAVHDKGIKSYANELTIKIAKEKNYPLPQIGFKDSLVIQVGRKKVICDYLGAGHTTGEIVVWIPDEKILFGSNSVRPVGSWYGNIGDANIDEWSATIEKVRAKYSDAKIVIPGHGNHGSIELLDSTISLYKPHKWGKILKAHNVKPLKVFNDYDSLFVIAEIDSIINNEICFINCVFFIDKGTQYIMIESDLIKYNQNNGKIKSDYGRLHIYSKSLPSKNADVDGYYKRLYLNLRDDAVKIELILKEFIR